MPTPKPTYELWTIVAGNRPHHEATGAGEQRARTRRPTGKA